MATFLPAPRHQYAVRDDRGAIPTAPSRPKPVIPPYGQRQKFVPRTMADFGDGGAYPEVHVAQYPLGMGKPGANTAAAAGAVGGGGANSSAIVAVDVDASGKVKHDAIVKQGTNRDKLVQTQLNNVKEKAGDTDKLAVPTEDEEIATAERTRLALEKIVGVKVTSATPAGMISQQLATKEAEFVRYTPNPNAPGFNPAAKQRVIRMVEVQQDPLEPPKHKHKKVPRGPPDDPVPVLHSPPRKVTVADQAAWKIPPCISNWKNARGYTIPLDKRLAADGRGLVEATVSHNFATLSESLYIAERKAREETRLRADMTKALALKEKEAKEGELRELAARARMERAGISAPLAAAAGGGVQGEEGGVQGGGGAGDEDERVAAQQRERLRAERKKDRERELRLESMKGNFKKGKVERERDISEKIALGQLKGTGGGAGGEGLYDSRLFNQSAGMSSGFGDESDYNLYSKPMLDRGEGAGIYRPRKSDGDAFGDAEEQMKQLTSTSRFKADRGFKGTEAGVSHRGAEPVQFERDAEEADPFGLDAFLQEATKGGKK
ncbi:SKIP/SNW domain-containing protein [Tribonema minus]|uniref:SKIP/SNW domain-containing protein n=1 Tax=Tribonema minus TaxID=303371 RepID=A0A835ZBA7_9STRA|nr:SKIP/SNW domain-containing protein [Tribonema minus]